MILLGYGDGEILNRRCRQEGAIASRFHVIHENAWLVVKMDLL